MSIKFKVKNFLTDKKHIAVFLLIIAAVLLISGFYRAVRISGRLTMMGLTFESDVHEGDSILLSASPLKAALKEAETEDVVCWEVYGIILTEYDYFIVNVAGKYRPVMVKKGTEEYDNFLNGGDVSGYFTKKEFQGFKEFMSCINQYYELDKEITDNDYSTLGIVIVDRQKELLSFLWGIPFLVAGLILLKVEASERMKYRKNLRSDTDPK